MQGVCPRLDPALRRLKGCCCADCWGSKVCPTAVGLEDLRAVMHSSAPLQMSGSRESPQPWTLQPYPDPELLSCRAPEFSPVGGKAGKRDCGTSKLDPKHYRIHVRLSDDPWPLRIMCHAETGYPGGKENLDFPFFCCCILCTARECSWPELKAVPPFFQDISVAPAGLGALLRVLQPRSPMWCNSWVHG